jgi:hypothetical protein
MQQRQRRRKAGDRKRPGETSQAPRTPGERQQPGTKMKCESPLRGWQAALAGIDGAATTDVLETSNQQPATRTQHPASACFHVVVVVAVPVAAQRTSIQGQDRAGQASRHI